MREILALLALCFLLAACPKNEDVTVSSNNELNDLQDLVEVADYFYDNPSIDITIVKKVEAMIYGKVLSTRTLQPEIDKLNGASIKGLCAVVALSREPSFGKALGDGLLSQQVTSYLASIEPRLKARTNDLKKTIFTDSDCAI